MSHFIQALKAIFQDLVNETARKLLNEPIKPESEPNRS